MQILKKKNKKKTRNYFILFIVILGIETNLSCFRDTKIGITDLCLDCVF